jgi:hypothetical protein
MIIILPLAFARRSTAPRRTQDEIALTFVLCRWRGVFPASNVALQGLRQIEREDKTAFETSAAPAAGLLALALTSITTPAVAAKYE